MPHKSLGFDLKRSKKYENSVKYSKYLYFFVREVLSKLTIDLTSDCKSRNFPTFPGTQEVYLICANSSAKREID